MTTQPLARPAASLRQVLAGAIAGGFLFAALFTAFGSFGTFSGDTDTSGHAVLGWLIAVAAALVAAAVVWMTGKAGAEPGNLAGAANRALVYGLLGVVSFPVFWLGIYMVFAAGSFVLGGAAIRAASGGTRARAGAGIALAGVATVFCAMLNLLG